ncbi:hypothetical protein [Ideonella sp.]|uniref:hypothetical protein n=1 Tax=Ideonella sp. TaxID=1929293 RepID=UPI0035AE3F88
MEQEVEQVVFWQHRMSASQATRLARLHHETFAVAGCRQCDGRCCKDCAENEGYFQETELTRAGLKRLKAEYGFDRKTGFRGPNGCRVPLNERSPTCNVFYCGARVNAFPELPTPADELPAKQRRDAVILAGNLRRAFSAWQKWI